MKQHYDFLMKQNVDVITSGNHVFKNKEIYTYIDEVDNLLRPENMGPYVPGIGTNIFKKNGKKIRVTNLIGRSFMDPSENPYKAMEDILENDNSDIHIVDFHAEATAEKLALATFFDGKITALVGTHTHVQTADERILPKGTGFLTDLGMTGCYESIIGAETDAIIRKERTGLPTRFEPASGKGQICGLMIEIDDSSNKVKALERLYVKE
ncbi:hypothetical protein Zmor_012132 [Zophobas morio]|uniref:Metallophosphoesterase n=1 Tax=Zophobas morio TaxID=2755281 RepID=A0AA38HGQ8_9CUCU|nr:hypothetical protein Zmor_012132 [Zophobas morio]